MALTTELQAQLDFQKQTEEIRLANSIAIEKIRAKLETVRLAKETLIENARSKPVDSREILASDITTFALTLENHING